MIDLKRELHVGASISLFWAMTRAYSLVGDPTGELETTDDVLGFCRRLRETPVVSSRTGFRYSADYEICSAVLRSPDASADIPEPRNPLEAILLGPMPPEDRIDPLLDAIIVKDGAEHSRIRKLVQPAFTHRVMQSWREATERVAGQLVDSFPTSGPVDLVQQWASPLPMAVICEILGVPFSERVTFSAWGDTLASGLDRARSLGHARAMEAAAVELTDYLAALLAERRRAPSDDLLSALAQVEVAGETLTDRDIVGTASFLLLAGFETTVNLLGSGTRVLLDHRNQLADVAADHSLIPGLVEESLRYVSPVQFTFRTALAPIDLPGGERLDERDTIVLMLVGANRDPSVFTDPDRFDIRRDNARRHLAFGFGVHHCLGAALARMEAEIAWRHLVERFPDTDAWQLAGDPVPTPGRMVRGLRSLPMTLGAAAHAAASA
ncbi:MAG: cytochrome P450 [Candidatus Nanopelagicales bacterium]